MLLSSLICSRAGQLIISSLPFLWRRQMFSWGSIYYLHHYNPSKESPGPLGHPFLECCKRSNWKNHSWELGMGAYLLKQMAPGSRDLVGVRGEGVGGVWQRDCLLAAHDPQVPVSIFPLPGADLTTPIP